MVRTASAALRGSRLRLKNRQDLQDLQDWNGEKQNTTQPLMWATFGLYSRNFRFTWTVAP